MIIQNESHQARNSENKRQRTEAQKYGACEWLLSLPKDIECQLTPEWNFQN